MAPPNKSGSVAKVAGAIVHLRQQRCRHAEQLAQFVVPFAAMDVEQKRARRVGRVGGVDFAAGKPPEQETIDCAESQPARRRGLRAPRHGRAARRSWWQRNTGRAAALYAPRSRASCPAPAAPHRRRRCGGPARRWRCGSACPVARSQTMVVSRWLVMPMAATSLRSSAGLGHRVAHGCERRLPDFLRIVLDQARRRIDLPEFLLRRSRPASARRSNRIARVEVVPWSIARRWSAKVPRPASGIADCAWRRRSDQTNII